MLRLTPSFQIEHHFSMLSMSYLHIQTPVSINIIKPPRDVWYAMFPTQAYILAMEQLSVTRTGFRHQEADDHIIIGGEGRGAVYFGLET